MPYDNPYQQRGGIMSGLMQALQAYSAIQSLKNAQQDRLDAQSQRQLDNEFRQKQFERQTALDEFNKKKYEEDLNYSRGQDRLAQIMKLNQIGAKQGNPQVEAALTAALGPTTNTRQAVSLPGGGDYYLPTEADTRKRNLREILDKNSLDVAGAIQMQQALLPYKVAQIEAQQRFEQQYAPPVAPRFVQTEAAGMGIDPRTGEQVWSNPELKRTPPASQRKAPLTQMDAIEKLKGEAQQALKEAQIWERSGDKDAGNKYAIALATAKAKEEEAKAKAAALQKLFPNNFRYQVDKDNNIAIDWVD